MIYLNDKGLCMWIVDTTKLYKIWISKYPDVFLDEENQALFLQDIKKNPQATFSFVFSSSCLSKTAVSELKTFCEKHKIKPFDFDTDLPPLLKTDQDKKLYELAKKEFQLACANEGGNLAASSDNDRVIVPLIEQCGIYSDFDVGVDFSSKPKLMQVKAPVVFAVEFLNELGVTLPVVCNEFLAVAIDPSNPTQIHPDALKRISFVQAEMIKRYSQGANSFFEHPTRKLKTDINLESEEARFIKHYFNEHPDADIFAFRKYIQQLNMVEYIRVMTLTMPFEMNKEAMLGNEEEVKAKYVAWLEKDKLGYILWRAKADPDFNQTVTTSAIIEKKLALLKYNLYVYSVTNVSGPINFHAFYQDKVPAEGFSITGNIFSAVAQPAQEWSELLQCFRNSSLQDNGLKDCVVSDNNLEAQRKSKEKQSQTDPLGLREPLSHQSWTPLGDHLKQNRIKEMKSKECIYQFEKEHGNTHLKL